MSINRKSQCINPLSVYKELFSSLNDKRIAFFEKRSAALKIEEIEYESSWHKVQGFIVYPKDLNKPHKHPVVIYNRWWNRWFSSINWLLLLWEIGAIAMKWFVVFATQYTGGPSSEWADQFWGKEDVKSVIDLKEIIDEIDFCDSDRISMLGFSRGGMMTYICLTKVTWIKSAVIIWGTSNLLRAVKSRDWMRKVCNNLFWGDKKDLLLRSAAYFEGESFPKETPVLILHWSNDWRVTPYDAFDMSKLFLDNKIPHRLIIFEWGNHSLSTHRAERISTSAERMHKYSHPERQLPDLAIKKAQ